MTERKKTVEKAIKFNEKSYNKEQKLRTEIMKEGLKTFKSLQSLMKKIENYLTQFLHGF